MKQILQSLKSGATEVADVPCPGVRAGQVLIRTRASLVSAGTERMLVAFGKAGLIEKARQQPDKVRMVLDKIKTDGLMPTLEAVFNKLGQPLPLGYCNVGVALEAGAGATGFSVGDRVASNGKHAEVVSVPMNLCAKVPANVSDDEAAFTVIGAIGLQGIRLAQPTLGEAVVVTGLGLIGLVTVQLLRAHGCRVLGIDYDADKLALARQFGAEVVHLSAGEDPVAAANAFSRGRGVDAVLITASTKSSEPVHQAALMCRKRGRIVLVGVAGLELSRADFYEKELSFQVSCSYGPGRYDPDYEEKGFDYPVGFVRWTEQRNLEAVLDMMADGRLDVKPLISHRFSIDEAAKVYELVGGAGPSLGILLQYPTAEQKPEAELRRSTVELLPHPQPLSRGERGEKRAAVAFVGSGNYATAVLIPAFKEAGARLKTVASSGGVSGVHAGRKFGFEETTTDADAVFADPEVNAVVISTRHDSHARLVCQALAAGKHVFVEKPLALTLAEIEEVEAAYGDGLGRPGGGLPTAAGTGPMVMVGFNRRFAPQVKKIKTLLEGVCDDRECGSDCAGALDAGRRDGRRAHRRRSLPFHRPAALSCRRDYRFGKGDCARQFRRGRGAGRQGQLHAVIFRRFARHSALSCQRPQVVPQRTVGSILCRQDSSTRKLQNAARLRLAGLFQNESVAAGQGPESLRRGLHQRHPQRRAVADPVRRNSGSRAGEYRGCRGGALIAPAGPVAKGVRASIQQSNYKCNKRKLTRPPDETHGCATKSSPSVRVSLSACRTRFVDSARNAAPSQKTTPAARQCQP